MEYTGHVRPQANYLVANYYKKVSYSEDMWAYVSGGIVVDFVEYVKVNYKDVTEFKNLIDPKSRKGIGIEHLMATLSAELYFPVPIVDDAVKDFAGWAGDMLSVMINVHRERTDESFDSTFAAAVDHIGAKTKASNFSYDDYMADVDAVNIANMLYNPALSIIEAFTQYYEGEAVMTRFSDFYQARFKSKKEKAQSSAETYMNSTSIWHTDVKVFREMFIRAFTVPEYTEEDGIAVAKAWADRISFDAMNE